MGTDGEEVDLGGEWVVLPVKEVDGESHPPQSPRMPFARETLRPGP